MYPMRNPLNPSGPLLTGPPAASSTSRTDDSSALAIQAILREAALYKQRASEHGVTAYLGRATAGERGVPDRRFLRNVISHTLAHNRAGGSAEASPPPSSSRGGRRRRHSDDDDSDDRRHRRRKRSRSRSRDKHERRKKRHSSDGDFSNENDSEDDHRRARKKNDERYVDGEGKTKAEKAKEDRSENDAEEIRPQRIAPVGPTRETAFGGKQVRGRGKRKFLKRKRDMELDRRDEGNSAEDLPTEANDDQVDSAHNGDHSGRKTEELGIGANKISSSESSSSSSDSDSETERRKRRKKRKERKKRRKEKKAKKRAKKHRKKHSDSESSSDD